MTLLKLIPGYSLDLVLAEITRPVELVLSSPETPEPTLLAALVDLQGLCPLVKVTQKTDPTLEVDHLAVRDGVERGVHFMGPPLGAELAALVSAVVVVGRGDSGLPEPIKAALAAIEQPVRLEVFTTPTCPNCSQMVSIAHKFAYQSPWITASAVSAVHFSELAQAYGVRRTPHTVINQQRHLRGRLADRHLLDAIRAALE